MKIARWIAERQRRVRAPTSSALASALRARPSHALGSAPRVALRAHGFSVQLRRKDEPDEMIVGTIRGLVTMSVLSHAFAMIHTTGCSARAATAIRIAAIDPPPSALCGIPSCARRRASATTPARARSMTRAAH